ncbi:hypothetical protein XA68_14734 [Ophiocordyceps unilateralis]|uniref:Capsule polysaccharide biosynthesis protein n=1 Tax=Ophiocordyceps unilateralis TaxID=268505 RepID=A0A2A9PMR6_OPHUN|nr:hypothetical protein XA68_14734 [Ophiocordyceps unilateralis]
MASASSKAGGLAVAVKVLVPLAVGSAGYAACRIDWRVAVRSFFTGPGRTSRMLLLLFVVSSWKSMPLVWTYRIFYTIVYHNALRKSPPFTPRHLFKPMINESRATLLEIDYNLHKSNSTFFSDLDCSRTHLVSYLCRRGLKKLAENRQTALVPDPSTGGPARGAMGIMLGSVSCSFKREVAPFAAYELWSRVIAWDRKWMYIVTHFVPKGAARPTEWLDNRCAGLKTNPAGESVDWDSKLHATALSKYVFKLGRLTVHPAIVLGASGLLPYRPGGWTSGENQLGTGEVGDVDLSIEEREWDWRRVEAQRIKGMELADHFQALDGMHGLFDGGAGGALGKFGPG